MDFERGYIYELEDGWGNVRLLEMFQEYESFDPDEPGDKLVRLIKITDSNNHDGKPFRMKLEMFKDLVIQTHGYAVGKDLY